MGSGMMQCWINDPATGGIDDKLKMVNILLKTNIPAFHPSIIPFPGQIRRPQKTSIFSVGCRNSETFNYTGRFLGRQADGNGAPGTLVVGRGHGATHQVNEFFYQGQTDSGAARGAGKGVIHPVKVVEDFF